MRRVLSLEIGIEKPYFKLGAALRETKNVPRVLILQEARSIKEVLALPVHRRFRELLSF
jgi:hypothetical protein